MVGQRNLRDLRLPARPPLCSGCSRPRRPGGGGAGVPTRGVRHGAPGVPACLAAAQDGRVGTALRRPGPDRPARGRLRRVWAAEPGPLPYPATRHALQPGPPV